MHPPLQDKNFHHRRKAYKARHIVIISIHKSKQFNFKIHSFNQILVCRIVLYVKEQEIIIHWLERLGESGVWLVQGLDGAVEVLTENTRGRSNVIKELILRPFQLNLKFSHPEQSKVITWENCCTFIVIITTHPLGWIFLTRHHPYLIDMFYIFQLQDVIWINNLSKYD